MDYYEDCFPWRAQPDHWLVFYPVCCLQAVRPSWIRIVPICFTAVHSNYHSHCIPHAFYRTERSEGGAIIVLFHSFRHCGSNGGVLVNDTFNRTERSEGGVFTALSLFSPTNYKYNNPQHDWEQLTDKFSVLWAYL